MGFDWTPLVGIATTFIIPYSAASSIHLSDSKRYGPILADATLATFDGI